MLGPASCPPLISLLLMCPLHPAGALAVPSPGLFAEQLLEMGREGKWDAATGMSQEGVRSRDLAQTR